MDNGNSYTEMDRNLLKIKCEKIFDAAKANAEEQFNDWVAEFKEWQTKRHWTGIIFRPIVYRRLKKFGEAEYADKLKMNYAYNKVTGKYWNPWEVGFGDETNIRALYDQITSPCQSTTILLSTEHIRMVNKQFKIFKYKGWIK